MSVVKKKQNNILFLFYGIKTFYGKAPYNIEINEKGVIHKVVYDNIILSIEKMIEDITDIDIKKK